MRACPVCGAQSSDAAAYCSLCLRPFGGETGGLAAPPAGRADAVGYQAGHGTPGSPYSVADATEATAPGGRDPAIIVGASPTDVVLAQARAEDAARGSAGIIERVSLADAWRGVFETEDLITKVLIALVMPIVPIVGSFAYLGYFVEYLSRSADGDGHLPEWFGTGFADCIVKGVVVTIAGFAYALPVVAISAGMLRSALSRAAAAAVSHATVAMPAAAFPPLGLFVLLYAIASSSCSPRASPATPSPTTGPGSCPTELVSSSPPGLRTSVSCSSRAPSLRSEASPLAWRM